MLDKCLVLSICSGIIIFVFSLLGMVIVGMNNNGNFTHLETVIIAICAFVGGMLIIIPLRIISCQAHHKKESDL